MISGHANIEMAVNSLKSGAFEFIQKPFDKERLLNFVNRAVENFNLKNENKNLNSKLFHSFELIGKSTNITSIRDQIQKLSQSESRVFISGPTGSGKELISRKIFKNSKRKEVKREWESIHPIDRPDWESFKRGIWKARKLHHIWPMADIVDRDKRAKEWAEHLAKKELAN